MTKDEIVAILKEHYPREVRKELVKSLLEIEKEDGDLTLKKPYQMINQIFSYVLQQAGWEMGQNSENWNDMPLKVMEESFPKLKDTKWYKEQIIETKKSINVIQQSSDT